MSSQTYPVGDGGLLLYEEELEALELNEDELNKYSGLDGEFYPFCQGRESVEFSEDTCYILPLQKAPSLFSRAYTDYEEVKAEIVAALGEQDNLPFDIDDRLGELSGTLFG